MLTINTNRSLSQQIAINGKKSPMKYRETINWHCQFRRLVYCLKNASSAKKKITVKWNLELKFLSVQSRRSTKESVKPALIHILSFKAILGCFVEHRISFFFTNPLQVLSACLLSVHFSNLIVINENIWRHFEMNRDWNQQFWLKAKIKFCSVQKSKWNNRKVPICSKFIERVN